MKVLLIVFAVYCIVVTIALRVIFEKVYLALFLINQNKEDIVELRKIVLSKDT